MELSANMKQIKVIIDIRNNNFTHVPGPFYWCEWLSVYTVQGHYSIIKVWKSRN